MATCGRPPRAIFMAFGTTGDVFPIAAVAAAFASDQDQHNVIFITHSAHKNLSAHLEAKNVSFLSTSSLPVVSFGNQSNIPGKSDISVTQQKKLMQSEHRGECLSIIESIFGNGPSLEADFFVVNFFALEGWNLAELFRVRCVVAAPYVVPYSAPASFERRFREELPELYEYFQKASSNEVSWKDIMHWMWPLFTEDWGSWRQNCLNLSLFPFTDPVTNLPVQHEQSTMLLYGFSKQVVECPGYWPTNLHVCGFWFPPMEWQFSCSKCAEVISECSSRHSGGSGNLCASHADLQNFLKQSNSLLIFVGLSSIGSMGFIPNPRAFLLVLKAVLENVGCRFILSTSGYRTLDAAIQWFANPSLASYHIPKDNNTGDGTVLFNNRLFCFSGSIPYGWMFPKCAAAIHHGGSGTTAAALGAGIPQIVCPFFLDQFYWAERMFWLGVAPEPLQQHSLVPKTEDAASIEKAARALSMTIASALSPEKRKVASEIASWISVEDGVGEAVKVLKEEVVNPIQRGVE